jgi:tRNA (uracil-5-)-methyltransferase
MTCKHFGECGSCLNYEKSYDQLLNEKIVKIEEDFVDFYSGKIDVATSNESHYRSRSEFKIWHKDDDIFYAMSSVEKNGVVLVEECPKVTQPIVELMPKLLLAIKEQGIDHKLFAVDFLASKEGEIVVTLIYHKKLDDEFETKAKEISKLLNVHIIGRSRKQKITLTQDFIIEKLHVKDNIYRYKYIENSFTQPNSHVNEQMISWALDVADDLSGDLLELYCGAGNFTIAFSSKFDKVLATEISKSSILAAKENMILNSVDNIEFVKMSSEEFAEALEFKREYVRLKDIDLKSYELKTLFVDPPRSGLDEKTLQFAKKFENIIYISCNPQTLKRDLEFLSLEYDVLKMALFDQFPYTNHLEMGVKLKSKN